VPASTTPPPVPVDDSTDLRKVQNDQRLTYNITIYNKNGKAGDTTIKPLMYKRMNKAADVL